MGVDTPGIPGMKSLLIRYIKENQKSGSMKTRRGKKKKKTLMNARKSERFDSFSAPAVKT